MKAILILKTIIPILSALNIGIRDNEDSGTCEDTCILCAFIPDASACDYQDEIKLRCPLKCLACPGRSMLHMPNVYISLNKCT